MRLVDTFVYIRPVRVQDVVAFVFSGSKSKLYLHGCLRAER